MKAQHYGNKFATLFSAYSIYFLSIHIKHIFMYIFPNLIIFSRTKEYSPPAAWSVRKSYQLAVTPITTPNRKRKQLSLFVPANFLLLSPQLFPLWSRAFTCNSTKLCDKYTSKMQFSKRLSFVLTIVKVLFSLILLEYQDNPLVVYRIFNQVKETCSYRSR